LTFTFKLLILEVQIRCVLVEVIEGRRGLGEGLNSLICIRVIITLSLKSVKGLKGIFSLIETWLSLNQVGQTIRKSLLVVLRQIT
jgi:hypothetical protein